MRAGKKGFRKWVEIKLGLVSEHSAPSDAWNNHGDYSRSDCCVPSTVLSSLYVSHSSHCMSAGNTALLFTAVSLTSRAVSGIQWALSICLIPERQALLYLFHSGGILVEREKVTCHTHGDRVRTQTQALLVHSSLLTIPLHPKHRGFKEDRAQHPQFVDWDEHYDVPLSHCGKLNGVIQRVQHSSDPFQKTARLSATSGNLLPAPLVL